MSNQVLQTLLATVPPKKVTELLHQTLKDCNECREKQAKLDNACPRCRVFNTAIHRYAAANIPIRYWKLEMKDFVGDKVLLEKYQEISQDLKAAYHQGLSLCFAGSCGTGKTLTATNILKRAVDKGYSGLYVTLNDIVACTINSLPEDRGLARRELLMADFLVIDEFDPRHMGSENSADLFGRILEDIFRTRAQNKMPIIMCTNTLKSKLKDSFNPGLKQSIESLLNYVENVPVLGKDQRKEGL